MEARKEAGRIKRAKGTKKDRIYLSFFGNERENVLKAIILSLQPRSYTLKCLPQSAQVPSRTCFHFNFSAM